MSTAQQASHDDSGDASAVQPVAALASPLPLSAPDVSAAPAQVAKPQHDSVQGHMPDQPGAAATVNRLGDATAVTVPAPPVPRETLAGINTQRAALPPHEPTSAPQQSSDVVANATSDDSGGASDVQPLQGLADVAIHGSAGTTASAVPYPQASPAAAVKGGALITLPGIFASFRRAVPCCAFGVLAARLQSSASYFDATISVELTSQADTFKVSSPNKESVAIFVGALQRSWTTHGEVIEDLMRQYASDPKVLEVLSMAFPNVGEPVVHPKGICVLYNPVTSHELDQRKSQTCKKLMSGWPDHLKDKVALLDLIPIFDSGKEWAYMTDAEYLQKALVNEVARSAIFTPYAVARIRHYAREARATDLNKFPVVLCVGKDDHKQWAIKALEMALSGDANVHILKCGYHPAANQCAENTPTLNRFLNALNGVYADAHQQQLIFQAPHFANENVFYLEAEVADLLQFAMSVDRCTLPEIRTLICLRIGYADGRKDNLERFVSGRAHGMDARILKFRELADEIYTMMPLQVAQPSDWVLSATRFLLGHDTYARRFSP